MNFGDWVAKQPFWVRIVAQWTLGALLIYISVRAELWRGVAVGVIALTSPFWPYAFRRLGIANDDDVAGGSQQREPRSFLRVSVTRRDASDD
jgi:hypothetical protein